MSSPLRAEVYLVNLKLFDTANSLVVGRVTRKRRGGEEALLEELPDAARELFGSEQDVRRETETVIVLTPHVVQHSEIHKELASEEDARVRAQVMEEAPLAGRKRR